MNPYVISIFDLENKIYKKIVEKYVPIEKINRVLTASLGKGRQGIFLKVENNLCSFIDCAKLSDLNILAFEELSTEIYEYLRLIASYNRNKIFIFCKNKNLRRRLKEEFFVKFFTEKTFNKIFNELKEVKIHVAMHKSESSYLLIDRIDYDENLIFGYLNGEVTDKCIITPGNEFYIKDVKKYKNPLEKKILNLNKNIFYTGREELFEGESSYISIKVGKIAKKNNYLILYFVKNFNKEIMHASFKKNRFYKNNLLSNNNYIVSHGWDRIESICTFFKQDKFIKKAAEFSTFSFFSYNLQMPVVLLNLSKYKICGVGTIINNRPVYKKLKLIGYPLKIFKNSAIISKMFTSEKEAKHFHGAELKSASNFRGIVKNAMKNGDFRATFEVPISMSDVIFLNTYKEYTVKKEALPFDGECRIEVQREECSSSSSIENKIDEVKEHKISHNNAKINFLKKKLPFDQQEIIEENLEILRPKEEREVKKQKEKIIEQKLEAKKLREEKEREERKFLEEKERIKKEGIEKHLKRKRWFKKNK